MEIAISLAIFLVGLWWCIKYSQGKAKKSNPISPPTLEDIQKKYPKRKSQEQIRAEALRARQADYDRKLAQRMALQGLRKASESKPTPNKREISVNSFRTLIRMLNGDEATARRLVEANIKSNPEKSPTWACDKAIADLERDRRI
ncbi:hypothetical protein [Pseudanabaena sp. UWO310]|uniref:hypothetical protein n=1 Tax=Pseudanabaena sp. UWO310 TaxID=2480795 RepID=UPI00115B1F27|nr:hypothetical protein [Pseudanabaena sp. UWO310]TYQ29973.1 hypothetical protein PseudUWO310_11170 [Pseudanabaena sp. UWO310]